MQDRKIIENSIDIKEAFGSFNILNEIDVMSHPTVYRFARIIHNYKKMIKLHEQI